MTSLEAQRAEAHANCQAFSAELPDLLEVYAGKYAAYRHQRLIGVFDHFADALVQCYDRYDDKRFSIHEITDERLDRGWFRFRYGSDGGAVETLAPVLGG